MTKQEQAYTTIRERILSGAYGSGYRLVIDSLAEELGVSALPVREAIRRLEAEGLVVFRANVGAQVAPADPGAYEAGLTVLAVLEGYATALAAPEMGREDVARLEDLNAQMAQCMETLDALRFGSLNQEFHLAIYDYCPNPYLVEVLRDTGRRLDLIRRTVFTQIPYRGRESLKEHRELIKLIQKQAPFEEIEAAARQHKLHTVAAFTRWREEHELTPTRAASAG